MRQGNVRGKLGIALLLTLVAAYFAPPPEEEFEAQVKVTDHRNHVLEEGVVASDAVTGRMDVLVIWERESYSGPMNVFNIQQKRKLKEVPVIKPEPEPIMQTPELPPLPFRVLGRYIENNKEMVFLQFNDKNLAVREGEMIDGKYRVDQISTKSVAFRNMAFDRQQTIDLDGQ